MCCVVAGHSLWVGRAGCGCRFYTEVVVSGWWVWDVLVGVDGVGGDGGLFVFLLFSAGYGSDPVRGIWS